MLAASGCFNIVTARHVVCFDELGNGDANPDRLGSKVREALDRLGLSDRGVDIVDLGPDTPEEYSFILDNLHAGRSISRRHIHVFCRVLEMVERLCGRERPILLKNPWDFGNGRLIKTLVPDAKLVYTHRNPFHTLSSLYRVVVTAAGWRHPYLSLLSNRYRTLTESEFPWRVAQWLGASRPSLLATGLIRHAAWSASGYLKSIRGVSCGDRIDVRFETLCRRPNETIARILEYLGVAGDDVDYRKMIGTHSSRVLPEIARRRDSVVARLGEYASTVGYDLENLPGGREPEPNQYGDLRR
jgi:DNA-directed RNA polymerase subunit N (RpoN/RPB10)